MTHCFVTANPTIQNPSMTQLLPSLPLDERAAKWFGHWVKRPKSKAKRLDATCFIKSIRSKTL